MLELWVIFAFISAITIAVSGILSKKLLKDLDSNQLMFEEYFLMLIFVLIFWFGNVDFLSFKYHWDLYLLKALFIFLFGFLYFRLLKDHDISTVSPLLNLSPVFLVIISSAFLGEVVTNLQLLGIFIVILATYFLEVNFHIHHNNGKISLKNYFNNILKFDWKIICLVISMLIIISFAAVVDKMIFSYVDVYTNMFFTAFLIALGLFLYYIKEGKLNKVYLKCKNNPLVIVFAGFKFVSTFFILKALAIPTAMVSLVIPIKRTSTLFSALIGGVIFHENHLIKKVISVLIMLVGVFIITM